MPTAPPPSTVAPGRHLEYEIVRESAIPGEGVQDSLRLAGGGVDWSTVVQTARFHGVTPLLYARLKASHAAVPPPVIEWLRGHVNARTAHGLYLFNELGRVNALLDEVGVRVVTVKGPVLAQCVYGSIALRPFVDLDLIVAPSHFRRAAEALTRAGFQHEPLSSFRQRIYLLVHRQYTYWKYASSGTASVPTTIDLHSALMPPGYVDAGGFATLWERSRSMPAGSSEVRMPGPEDHLMVLAFHGFKNRWNRLKYAVDFAETIRAESGVDWGLLLHMAQEGRWRRVLALALAVGEQVAGLEVPQGALSLREDPRAQHLAREVAAHLPVQAEAPAEPLSDRVRMNLLAQDGLRGQARYAAYVVARRLSELVLPVDAPD